MTTPLLPDEEARRRAATELGTTFLVEAGAGTGKTSVLLQRLLTLVRSGRSPLERVSAITFTERAAAELRVRLRSEIETALAGPLSDEERRNLREARSQLEHAQISTVHAFCAALLRERPVEARVDPAFSVLDQFGANLLRSEAWHEWLAQEMDRGPAILKRALRAGVTLAHLETLRDFVVEQRDCLSLLPATVEAPLPEFRAILTRAVTRLLTLTASCVNPTDRALAQITTLAALVPAAEDDLLWERLLLRNLPLSSRAGTKANWKPTAAFDEARALFDQISTAHTQTRATMAHNLSVGLARWLDGSLRAYQEKKRERSSLDFVDLLLLTRDLLRHNLEVRRALQGRFHFLLVDEFQDTDPLQAEIIFFLAEREPRAAEWTTVGLQPGKLFLVGDPQQSVYRFRRADLEVYAQVRAAIAQQGEVLSLSTNFRARAPALTWINETFTHEFASVGVDQPSYRPLVATRQEDTGREVIFLPVSGVPAQPSREALRQAEARTVAAFITQTIERGSRAVWGGRAIGYRDIAVLFRTYQAMEAYEEALRDAGVPYRVVGGRRYASRQEVEELRALLRTVESPSDTTALVATLRSSLFGFSDEELALFVSAGGRLDYTARSAPPICPAADRFTAAFALLRDLHTRRVQVSPALLLSEIYTRTHLVPFFALRPQGVQRVANLLKLIDTARALSAQGLPTLTAFNRFLDEQENAAEEAEQPVMEEHEEALRLLTIHKAKGLEFPVVTLADAMYHHGRSSRTGISERVGGNLELRVGPRDLTCTTQGWQKAEAREQERDAAEERRLWYVAATRVRDHLVIPVTPRVEGSVKAELWALEDGLPCSGPVSVSSSGTCSELGRRGSMVFVYHNNAPTPDQTVPVPPAAPVFTSLASHPIAVHAYQTWEAEQRTVRIGGSRVGAISAVTALAETAAPGGLFSEQGWTTSSVARQASLRLGRAVHAALRGMSGNAVARLLSSQVSGLWTTAEREEVERLVQNALASPVLARAQTVTECFAEVPFILHYGDRLLEGAIDLAFLENGAWVIVDFKTDAVAGAEAAVRAAVYRPQLCLYALALEQLTGRTVTDLVLLFVRSQQTVSWPWGDSERALAEAVLARMPSTAGSQQ